MREPPRLSTSAREAIHQALLGHVASETVAVSRILQSVRDKAPDLRETDEEIADHLVEVAAGRGFVIEFDHTT